MTKGTSKMLKVSFYPKTKEVELNVDAPVPSKLAFPDWYKKIPKFENNKFETFLTNEGRVESNTTIKSCMPFFDTFTTGYIQKTWCDILIEYDEVTDRIGFKYPTTPAIMGARNKVSCSSLLDNNEFYAVEFTWQQPWVPRLPKGYSMLYTHPLNRTDLPFQSLSGIIDNDEYKYEADGSHPFFIKRGFTGVIPAGTPMYQMIPIKRESWEHEVCEAESFVELRRSGAQRYFYDGYKKLFWNKKDYS